MRNSINQDKITILYTPVICFLCVKRSNEMSPSSTPQGFNIRTKKTLIDRKEEGFSIFF
jgi:hypothetical protein